METTSTVRSVLIDSTSIRDRRTMGDAHADVKMNAHSISLLHDATPHHSPAIFPSFFAYSVRPMRLTSVQYFPRLTIQG